MMLFIRRPGTRLSLEQHAPIPAPSRPFGRSLWNDLKEQDKASEAELNDHQISQRALRRMACGRR